MTCFVSGVNVVVYRGHCIGLKGEERRHDYCHVILCMLEDGRSGPADDLRHFSYIHCST